jgi:hypothetical protein
MQSDKIDKLAPALVAALPGLPHAPMDSNNPHFKSRFASLKSILDVARPALAEHGLFITQSVTPDSVVSRIMHSSGQWIGSECRIVCDKETCQGQGSGITYARRYSLAPLLGIYSDEDDDGNAAESAQIGSGSRQSQNRPEGTGDMGFDWREPRAANWDMTCCVCGETINQGAMCEWNGRNKPDNLNRHPGGRCAPQPVDNADIPKHIRDAQEWVKENDPGGDDDIPFDEPNEYHDRSLRGRS